MYKSRFRIWVLVFLFAFVASELYTSFSPVIKEYIEVKKQQPTTASIVSDKSVIRQRLNNEKINGTKLINRPDNSKEADIIIGEEAKNMDGYKSEIFYSPIVAVAKGGNRLSIFKKIESTSSAVVREIDLKSIMRGFLADQKFKECYPGGEDSGSSLKNKPVELLVDTRYEEEIKATMLMAMAGTHSIDKEDADEYMSFVNQVWDKAEKTDNSTQTADDGLENKILLTEEQNIILDGNAVALYPENTVAVKYFVSYHENVEYVVKSMKFMKKLGIRRIGVSNYYKSPYQNAAWTFMYIYNTDIPFDLGLYTAEVNPTKNQDPEQLNREDDSVPFVISTGITSWNKNSENEEQNLSQNINETLVSQLKPKKTDEKNTDGFTITVFDNEKTKSEDTGSYLITSDPDTNTLEIKKTDETETSDIIDKTEDFTEEGLEALLNLLAIFAAAIMAMNMVMFVIRILIKKPY